MTDLRTDLSPIQDAVEEALQELEERGAVERMWQRDHTLWQDEPTEVADRLAWLELPSSMRAEVERLRAFRADCGADGITDALVVGMGGSSLFPLVLSETFASSGIDLHVLDSIDPGAVQRVTHALPLERTLVIASSKSGTTVETRSLLAHFWERIGRGDRFAVVTDPGTSLAELARDRGFREVFEAEPDVGGRFSALSHFGLVPAAVLGVDVAALLHEAQGMAESCAPEVPLRENPAATLAAALGGAVRSGRDKLTLLPPPGASAMGAWIEQLVAESTGKAGRGVLPVVGEPLGEPDVYGDDRIFVAYGDDERLDGLAAAGHPIVRLPSDAVSVSSEAFRWEAATALVGVLLDVNPFDQPDVESAKRAARRSLDEGIREPATVEPGELLATVRAGDHVVLLVYADPEDPLIEELEEVRRDLRDQLQVATTLGVGPRYLHSTGQLHKGGPDNGVFLQVLVPDDEGDLTIPGQAHTFGMLKRAQAAGDLSALRERGRRAGRVQSEDLLGYGRERR